MNDRHAEGHERWLELASAYAIGALDEAEMPEFERHLEGCEACRSELQWLRPAVDALPESVQRLEPPPGLRERILQEAQADARAADVAARREQRAAADGERVTFGAWLGRLGSGALGWKPLAAAAAAFVLVIAFVGYEVGKEGGDSNRGGQLTRTIPGEEPIEGITAKVVTNGRRGQVRLVDVPQLPDGRVLEAWVQRDGEIEAVRDLFVPNDHGDAATAIADMRGVEKVLVTREPKGGSKAPTSTPLAAVEISRRS